MPKLQSNFDIIHLFSKQPCVVKSTRVKHTPNKALNLGFTEVVDLFEVPTLYNEHSRLRILFCHGYLRIKE